MSFNRLAYDTCEVEKYNQETTGPGNYLYDTPLMCDNCLNDNPRIINQKNGVSMNGKFDWRFYAGPVDVESELFNITRQNSKCPTKKYSPNCSPKDCGNQGEPCGAGVSETCTDSKSSLRNPWNRPGDNDLVNFPKCTFPTEDTRLSNPVENLRGTGWNRFDPLCKDPQQQITFPGEYLTSTRIVFKDNHRPCVVSPKVNNMDPNEEMPKCEMIGTVCANSTKPLYQYDVCG